MDPCDLYDGWLHDREAWFPPYYRDPNRIVTGAGPEVDQSVLDVMLCVDVVLRKAKDCSDLPDVWTEAMVDALIIHALCRRCLCAHFEAYYFSSQLGFSWPQTRRTSSKNWSKEGATITKDGIWVGTYIWWQPTKHRIGYLKKALAPGKKWTDIDLDAPAYEPDLSRLIPITGGIGADIMGIRD